MEGKRAIRTNNRTYVNGAVHGVVAVAQRDGRLLLIRRAAGVAAPDKWCFPGGGVEPGESGGEAIRREMQEELGIRVCPIRQVWQWRRPDGRLLLDWWEVQPASVDLVPDPAEVAEARWLLPAEIRSLPAVLPGLLEFMDRFYPPTAGD